MTHYKIIEKSFGDFAQTPDDDIKRIKKMLKNVGLIKTLHASIVTITKNSDLLGDHYKILVLV